MYVFNRLFNSESINSSNKLEGDSSTSDLNSTDETNEKAKNIAATSFSSSMSSAWNGGKSLFNRALKQGKETLNSVKEHINEMGDAFDDEVANNYGDFFIEEEEKEGEIVRLDHSQEKIIEIDNDENEEELEEDGHEINYVNENGLFAEIENNENEENLEEIIENENDNNGNLIIENEHPIEREEELLEYNENNMPIPQQQQGVDILALKANIQALNISGNSTQKILSEAVALLKAQDYEPTIKSKLNSDKNGYILETFNPLDDQGNRTSQLCYRIKVTYTIYLDAAKEQEPLPSIERYIYTNITAGSSQEKALLLASKYKEMMVGFAEDPAQRITGYDENKKEDLLNQRSFIFNVTHKEGQITGVNTIKALNTPSLKDVELNVKSKPDRQKSKYVESLLWKDNKHGKAKRKDHSYLSQKNEVVYSSKDEALLHARYTVDAQPGLSLMNQMAASDSKEKYLKETLEKIDEKKKKLEEIKKKLVNSSLLGKNHASEELTRFIDYMQVDASDTIQLQEKDLEFLNAFIQDEARIAQNHAEDQIILKKLAKKYIAGMNALSLDRINLFGENYSVKDLAMTIRSKIEGKLNERDESVQNLEKTEKMTESEYQLFKLDLIQFQKLNTELEALSWELYEIYKSDQFPEIISQKASQIKKTKKTVKKNNGLIDFIFDKI